MKTDDRRPLFRRSLAGVVLAAVLLALWGAATHGSLPSGSTEPAIASLTPESGPEGMVVTIGGSNFGPSIGAVQGTSGVSFNGVWATPSSWSDTEIRVAVPPGAATGPVVVTVSSQPSNGVGFTVTGTGGSGPAIGTVSPVLGPEGTVVTVRGANFGPTADMGGVSFNGVWAAASSWSDEEIRVPVPADATTGSVVVTVNGQASNGVAFIVTDSGLGEPVIDSLSAVSGPEGMVVRIEGENFGSFLGTSQGTSGVSFNGVWASPTYWSETQIQVPVPARAPSGLVTVTVGGEGSNGLAFVVERPAPLIEAVNTTFGREGTTVEITGRNFGPAMEASQGWSGVSFDELWGVPTYWSDREIHVSAPAGVSGGLIVVTSVGQESNGIPFTVARAKRMSRTVAAASTAPRAGPELKSLDPAGGSVGTPVKIKGKNLGDEQGGSTVTFNGTAVTNYVTWSNKKIDVTVPSGATTGPVVVTIGGVPTQGLEFTVTAGTAPTIGSLDPDSGPEGTTVEITGTNFGASQGTSSVTFNGTPATPTNWSDTSITVAVPMGATTGEVVVTVDGTASSGVSFTVAPAIGSLSPDSGPEGTTVEITGTSFGAMQGTSSVTFNGTGATPTSWSDTSITVTVPAGATTGSVVVTVGGTPSDGASFTVTPAIGSLSPIAGPEGTTVEITGTSFGAMQRTSSVTFNGTGATPTSWSDTSITVTVPMGATTGDVVVTVGGEASNGVSFAVGTDPVISAVSPASGPVGTTVVITGANFGASQGTGSVTFNETPATPSNWSDTSITLTVPTNATTGNVVVTVDGTASNAVTFSVKPVIRGLSRVSGPEGAAVVITGTSFGAMQGTSTVTFNGTGATPTSWSDTSITVTVPTGAATGSVVVTVGGTASDGVSFTVTPAINSLSPIVGPEGATVVIAGTSFGAMQGTSTVSFNGVTATPTSWSDTSITVTVPAGATTGPVVVTVGGESSNQVTFTVTGPPPVINKLKPGEGGVGDSVKVKGEHFGTARGTSTVTFNGEPAISRKWGDDKITVNVPAGARTGPVVVTVEGQASNPVTFSVTGSSPSIISLDPTSGEVGTSVTIAGVHFGATQGTGTVTFNGVAVATYTSWSDTAITVPVPATAATGPVVVTVGAQASNGVTFTVTVPAPSITGLNPTEGRVGASVAISGTNFGDSHGTGTVTFNGVAATPTSWSGTSITVAVPATAETGNVIVTVGGQASNPMAFTVVSVPAISSLNPGKGPEGTPVTIAGANFGDSQGTSTVTFNGVAATPTNWSVTSITAAVPAGATTGNVVVTVGGEASDGVEFAVTPAISGLNSTSGPEGTSIEITGTGFGATQGTSSVSFNGTAATPTSWSGTSIAVTVPAGAATGNVVVTVDSQASNGVVFTVTPAISSVSPDSGAEGTSVDISGTSFGATQGASTVTFNGTAATPTSWSGTSITVTVPAGATTGNVVVTVDGQASNAVAFTVKPSISGLNPSGGPVAASVEISGTNFGDSQRTSTVTFNGVTATASSWDDTSIAVTVPAGATTGNVVVTVGGQASNGVAFTVKPSISGLNPSGGPVETSVEITGTSFGDSQGTSTVTFNGTAVAAYTSWSDTSITVEVPAGGATGPVVVTVDGQASNGVTFTVTPAISALNPTSGPEGTTVEITGTSFGPTQGTGTVTFNGTAATPTSWSDTSITVAVPAGATTGNVVVTVGGQASNGVAFTVKPSISGLNPDSGPVGASVEISGTNFGDSQRTSTVTFNGVTATASSWDDTSIAVTVPAGATTGNVVVTVDGQASNGVAFTVKPSISGLNPSGGPVETSVVISGATFGATQGPSTVTFNGTAVATYSSWSDTSITVEVPAGATTGNVVVTVGGQASNGVTFTVTENRAPETEGKIAAQTVNKGDSADLTVSSYFSDPDEDTLEYTVASSDTSKVSVAVTGAVVTVSGVLQGSATVTVTASDGSLTAQQGFTVTVPNRAPEAEGPIPTQTVNKGDSSDLTVSRYFSDPDEDDLEYTVASSDTSKVSVTVTGAVVTLTGVAQGSATVTVTASDGSLTATQSFTVTVSNRAPEAEGTIPAQTVNKGESTDLTVSSYFSDPDEDTLEYSVVSSDTAKVTVAVTGAVVTLTGVLQGDATVTVTASDGDLTAQQGFTVTVPNRAPEAVGQIGAQTVNKGSNAPVTVSGNFRDPDMDDLNYTVSSSDTSKVSVSVSGAVVTVTGVAQGSATVTVTASDGSLTAQQGFTVTVPNRAPEAVGQIAAQMVNKGSNVPVTVSGNFRDPDMDSLTYTASSSDTSKVSVSVSGAVVTVSGVSQGSATVMVTASDGSLTAQQGFTATVPNRAPEAVGTIAAQTVNKGSNAPVPVSGNFRDPDMDTLTYTASSSDTSKVSVSVSGAVVTVSGVSQGSATVTVTASDGSLTAQQSFTATVPNRAPEAVGTISAQTVNKGSNAPVPVSGNFRDPDMDNLSYSASSSDTSKVSVSVSGAVVTVSGVSQGSATVTVTASDGSLTAQQSFTATVPNRAPEAVGTISAQTVNKGSNAPVPVSGNFRDPDMDTLTYSASSSDTSKVSVSVTGAVVTLTGVAQGSATVTVTASDGSLTAQQGFTVTVPNRAPRKVGSVSAQSVNKNASKGVSVSGKFSDADGDRLDYSARSNSSDVSVTVSGSTVTITGESQTTTPVTVTVTASDGHGGTAQQGFTVTVPNRAPVKVGSVSGQSVYKKASKGVSVSGKFSDADGDTLTYSARSDSSDVSVTVNGSTVTIEGESQGGATVTVTASDRHGGTAQLTFGVTVPNRPPRKVGSVSAQSVYKNARKDVSVSGKFSDADGDGLDYSVRSSDTSKVTVSVDEAVVTITGESQTTTTVTVTVTASDGFTGGTATLSFSVRVPNRAPVKEGDIDPQQVYKKASKGVSVAGKFSDADGDRLDYSARSSDPSKLTVSVSGSTVTIRGESQTTSAVTVRVTASDGHGGSATLNFRVTVPNRAPVKVDDVDPQEVNKKSTKRVSVSGKFSDADMDNLTYSATSSHPAIVSIDGVSGAVVTIEGESQGSTTVTVTATDPHNATATLNFPVTVPNRKPVKKGTIPAQTVSKGSSKQVTVSGYFSDPDMDTLSYSASSADTSKVTASVSGSTLTITGVSQTSSAVTVTVTADDGHQGTVDQVFDVTVNQPALSTPNITSISPSLQRPDDPVTIYGNHFGSTAGSVSFGGHSISIFSGPGYSWSNTSISLLIPGSLHAGQVSVSVTTSGGTSNSYSYTVTGGPVSRGDCEEGDEDCPEGKEDKESGDSDGGGTDEDSAEGGG